MKKSGSSSKEQGYLFIIYREILCFYTSIRKSEFFCCFQSSSIRFAETNILTLRTHNDEFFFEKMENDIDPKVYRRHMCAPMRVCGTAEGENTKVSKWFRRINTMNKSLMNKDMIVYPLCTEMYRNGFFLYLFNEHSRLEIHSPLHILVEQILTWALIQSIESIFGHFPNQLEQNWKWTVAR